MRRWGKSSPASAWEVPGHVRVVERRKREGLGGQLLPQIRAVLSALDRGQHAVVVIRIGDGPDIVVILGCGANHGRAADVDVLDDFRAIVGSGQRRREWIQVDGDEVDGRQPMFGELLAIACQVGPRENSGVNRRVERLHAAVEHLGPARHRVDRPHRHSGIPQRLSGA